MARTLVPPDGRSVLRFVLPYRLELSALMVCCLSPWLAGDEPAKRKDPPTFTRDVAPIIQKKCQNCHRSHHIGPFALETYEQARKRATDLAMVVSDRQMPPWKPAPGVGPRLKHDQSLSPEEIAVFEAWAETGTLRGDPKDMPPPPSSPPTGNWGRPTSSSSQPRIS